MVVIFTGEHGRDRGIDGHGVILRIRAEITGAASSSIPDQELQTPRVIYMVLKERTCALSTSRLFSFF